MRAISCSLFSHDADRHQVALLDRGRGGAFVVFAVEALVEAQIWLVYVTRS